MPPHVGRGSHGGTRAVPDTIALPTGAQVLVQALRKNGARCLFGIPGVHTLYLYDALAEHPGLVPVVTRHEAGATFAADGYARLTGRPGVVSVVPGPGALNAATGVLTAWSDRVPMVVMTTDLGETSRRGEVHECDLETAYRPFTKAQFRPEDQSEFASVVHDAFHLAANPPEGPVQVLLPVNELKRRAGPTHAPAADPPPQRKPAPPGVVERVERFLRELRSPTMLLGTGVVGAAGAAVELAEHLDAPTFTDVAARGLIPEDHPLAAGLLSWPHARSILECSDGMLVLGSRLSEITTLNWDAALPANLARVDADPDELHGNYPATVAVECDPVALVRGLLGRLPAPARVRRDRVAAAAASGKADEGDVSEPGSAVPRAALHPLDVVRELRKVLPRDAVVTTDATATEFWLSEPTFPIYASAGFLLPEVQQTMGYALSAAVGAVVANAELATSRPVVCITGDGSLQMLAGELATAAGLGHRLTIVVFDDGYYNALRIYQDALFGRLMGVTLQNPDFVALAEAYGAAAARVDELAAVGPAVERALCVDGLSLVAVSIDPLPLPRRYRRRIDQLHDDEA